MDWYYDKKKIVSIATAIVVVISGVIAGGFTLDSNAQTDLDIAVEAITSEMATADYELLTMINALPTQQDIVDLNNSISELRDDIEKFIEVQRELDIDQREVIDDMLNQLDAIADDLADIEENLYGEDGIWEVIEEMQDDIDYIRLHY